MFLYFNLFMFTEEDGTSINNEDRKEFQIRKKYENILNFLTFKKL